MAGVAALFTREFFTALRDRLAPDGILCQWAHTYDISGNDLRSVAATFASVFPGGTMWLVGDGDLLLIGSRRPVDSRLDRVARGWLRLPVAASLADVWVVQPFSLLALCLGGDEYVKTYARNGAIQSDDRLALEYSAPRSIWGRARSENVRTLRELAALLPAPSAAARARADASAAEWRSLGIMLSHAQAGDAAYEAFRRAVELDPADRAALDGLVQASGLAGRQREATALVEQLSERQPDRTAPRLVLSRLAADRGDLRQAAAIAADALARDPRSAEAREQLASVLADAQDLPRLRALVGEMERDDPWRADTRFYAATVRFLEGNTQAAGTLARQAIAIDRSHGRAWMLLAIATAELDQRQQAREAFARALEADPRNANAYVNFGLFELQSGDPRSAGNAFAEALTIDSTSRPALEGLADVLEREGQMERAAELRDRARRGARAESR
jgi:Tfp pilus assembly protein PilF